MEWVDGVREACAFLDIKKASSFLKRLGVLDKCPLAEAVFLRIEWLSFDLYIYYLNSLMYILSLFNIVEIHRF